MRFFRRCAVPLLAAALAASALVSAPTEAAAYTSPPGNGYWDKPVVVVMTRTPNFVNTSQLLAKMQAPVGQTVTITQFQSATRTIQVTAALNRSGVAAQLGIASSTTVGVSGGCTLRIPAGHKYGVAYSLGEKITYRIREVYHNTTTGGTTTYYSSTLTAFNPYPSGISCRTTAS